MADAKEPCAHPRMCPEQDSFAARIKAEKLALESPPPGELTAAGRKKRR